MPNYLIDGSDVYLCKLVDAVYIRTGKLQEQEITNEEHRETVQRELDKLTYQAECIARELNKRGY